MLVESSIMGCVLFLFVYCSEVTRASTTTFVSADDSVDDSVQGSDKPSLVSVCFTVASVQVNFVVVDIYKIFERCLLSGHSCPRSCILSLIHDVVFIDFILSSFISIMSTCQCCISQKPLCAHVLEIETRSKT